MAARVTSTTASESCAGDRRTGRRTVAASVGIAALALAACSPQHLRLEREADARATTAGNVMTRGYEPEPVEYAAAAVVGHVQPVTISALRVSGTTWKGSATLKITVEGDGSFGSDSEYTACYSYTFDHVGGGDDAPTQLDACPSGPTVAVSPAPPLPPITDATGALVRRALTGLTVPQRRDLATVRAAVQRAVGPAYAVGVDGPSSASNGVFVRVSVGESCLAAYLLRTGGITIGRPAEGMKCRS